MSWMRIPSWRRVLAETWPAALLALLTLWAASYGARGPLTMVANLGPGDSTFTTGFTPRFEVRDRVGTHWTSYDATVALPLLAEGGPIAVSYRYARVLPETAVVDVSLAGTDVDRFTCRGGRVEDRRVELAALPETPLSLRFLIDSHDRQRLGLKLDRVVFELGERARVRLAPGARLAPILLVAIAFLILRVAGWGRRGAAVQGGLLALGVSFGLLSDPWLTHRMVAGVPLLLAIVGGLGLAVGWRLGCSRPTLRALATIVGVALLLRAAAVNHPDFFYPDLHTHARFAEEIREAGLGFAADPGATILQHGVWKLEAFGRSYAFPYSPAFHLPFVLSPLRYDGLITAMKLVGVALSVVPIALVWALAVRVGVPPLIPSLLMLVVPTYATRLSFAFLPSLLGHVFDLVLLLWLAYYLPRIDRRAAFGLGAIAVAASQLAYVSGLLNSGALVLSVSLLLFVTKRPRQAVALAAVGVAGAAISLILYYGRFLDIVAGIVPRPDTGAELSAGHYEAQSFLAVACARTRDFFDGVLPLLALAGLFVTLRRARHHTALLVGWGLAYLLLLLGRAKLPDIFLHGHETTLVTPLVCLMAGAALADLAHRGRPGRVLATVSFAYIAAWGVLIQWRAFAAQLQNAL